jgi:hypothetical protein
VKIPPEIRKPEVEFRCTRRNIVHLRYGEADGNHEFLLYVFNRERLQQVGGLLAPICPSASADLLNQRTLRKASKKISALRERMSKMKRETV